MNGKSSVRTSHLRSGSSQSAEILSTFRQQMADHARGERLRELREARHLSQEDAAHAIGVSTRTLREWEKGGKIKWPNAKKAAATYEVEPETLVSREAIDFAGQPLTTADVERLTRIEELLEEIIRRLPPAQDEPPAEDIPDAVPPEQGPPPDAEDEGEAATG